MGSGHCGPPLPSHPIFRPRPILGVCVVPAPGQCLQSHTFLYSWTLIPFPLFSDFEHGKTCFSFVLDSSGELTAYTFSTTEDYPGWWGIPWFEFLSNLYSKACRTFNGPEFFLMSLGTFLNPFTKSVSCPPDSQARFHRADFKSRKYSFKNKFCQAKLNRIPVTRSPCNMVFWLVTYVMILLCLL